MILVVDNYDSFTYNLVQYLGELGADPLVRRNDAVTPEQVRELAPQGIVLSPGPKTPADHEPTLRIIRELKGEIPMLGVCLGHQAICTVFGGEVVRARHLMHGKTSAIRHDGTGIFDGVPTPFTATRYHSLIAREGSLPEELRVTATSMDDGYIMGVRHRNLPIDGVQFHPESILSAEGDRIIRNFLNGTGVRS